MTRPSLLTPLIATLREIVDREADLLAPVPPDPAQATRLAGLSAWTTWEELRQLDTRLSTAGLLDRTASHWWADAIEGRAEMPAPAEAARALADELVHLRWLHGWFGVSDEDVVAIVRLALSALGIEPPPFRALARICDEAERAQSGALADAD